MSSYSELKHSGGPVWSSRVLCQCWFWAGGTTVTSCLEISFGRSQKSLGRGTLNFQNEVNCRGVKWLVWNNTENPELLTVTGKTPFMGLGGCHGCFQYQLSGVPVVVTSLHVTRQLWNSDPKQVQKNIPTIVVWSPVTRVKNAFCYTMRNVDLVARKISHFGTCLLSLIAYTLFS